MHPKEFGDLELRLEYKMTRGGNSGVTLRCPRHAPRGLRGIAAEPAFAAYEIQLLDYDDTNSTGSIYGLTPAKTGVHRPGLWNSMDIESRPGRIRVRVNGEVVADGPGDPARPKTGPIGLQLHDRFTTVMFRNIRIRVR